MIKSICKYNTWKKITSKISFSCIRMFNAKIRPSMLFNSNTPIAPRACKKLNNCWHECTTEANSTQFQHAYMYMYTNLVYLELAEVTRGHLGHRSMESAGWTTQSAIWSIGSTESEAGNALNDIASHMFSYKQTKPPLLLHHWPVLF